MSDQLPLPAPPPERPEVPPPPEEVSAAEPSTRTSRAPLVVGLLLAAFAFGGAFLVYRWIAAPSVCGDANLRSDRFGYCLSAPAGWRVAEPQGGQLPADELFRPDGDATLMIQAVETGRDLNTFVTDVRSLQQSAGLDTGDVTSTTVAGAPALEWDATITTSAQSIEARTVVFERDGVAWRVQFADSTRAFRRDVRDLRRVLESWHFV
jgi:hypothetical protein